MTDDYHFGSALLAVSDWLVECLDFGQLGASTALSWANLLGRHSCRVYSAYCALSKPASARRRSNNAGLPKPLLSRQPGDTCSSLMTNALALRFLPQQLLVDQLVQRLSRRRLYRPGLRMLVTGGPGRPGTR
jgi:hypothetical protein